MIEVRIPKEIKDYKEKLFVGLTLRQCICTALAMGICVPLYIKGRSYINEELLSWIIIVIAMPLILIGYFNYNQMQFEKFFIEYMKMMINPQKRLYKEQGIYEQIRKEVLKDEERTRKGQRKIKKRKSKEAQETKTKGSKDSTANITV